MRVFVLSVLVRRVATAACVFNGGAAPCCAVLLQLLGRQLRVDHVAKYKKEALREDENERREQLDKLQRSEVVRGWMKPDFNSKKGINAASQPLHRVIALVCACLSPPVRSSFPAPLDGRPDTARTDRCGQSC
jgi:hypothetical protein|eukprot:SAG25_NODE_2118_length_1927_cov_2.015317_2_plen_133_part_00